MTLNAAGFSGDSFVCLGQETTAGTAVNPTLIVDATFTTPATADFNPDRREVQVNVGKFWNTIGAISRQSQYRASMTTVVLPETLGATLVALGFTNTSGVYTPTRPKPCTLFFVDGSADTEVYSGARLSRAMFRANQQQELQATFEFFVATTKPAKSSGAQDTAIAALTYTGGTVLGFPDLAAPTLLGGTTNAELNDWEVTFDFQGLDFQGPGGEFPTRSGNDGLVVTGRFTPLHVPAEYVAMRDGTAGALNFTFGGTKHIAFALPNAKYTRGPLGFSRQRFNTEAMEFLAYTPDLTTPASITIALS